MQTKILHITVINSARLKISIYLVTDQGMMIYIVNGVIVSKTAELEVNSQLHRQSLSHFVGTQGQCRLSGR